MSFACRPVVHADDLECIVNNQKKKDLSTKATPGRRLRIFTAVCERPD